MKTFEDLIIEEFCDEMEKNLDAYEKKNGELLKKECVMDKKKWEPTKAPNPYYH